MVIDTLPNKEETFTCRQVAHVLGLSPGFISTIGRAQKWPGAEGLKWRVPMSHIRKLKQRIQEGGSLI